MLIRNELQGLLFICTEIVVYATICTLKRRKNAYTYQIIYASTLSGNTNKRLGELVPLWVPVGWENPFPSASCVPLDLATCEFLIYSKQLIYTQPDTNLYLVFLICIYSNM